MTEFLTISQGGTLKSHRAECDADPQSISNYLKGTDDASPATIITVHFGSPMIAKRGSNYFDNFGDSRDVMSIINDWLNNLDANELAKIYTHVTGCDCKAFDDDNEADSFAYNMGG